MSTSLTFECHGKNYQHKAGPMQPLQTVIPAVLRQAGLESKVCIDECQLILKGTPLDLSLPVRFANVARGDKILLRTGHEPLLGVQQQTDRVSKAKTSNTDVERERDAVGKLDDHPSSVPFAVQDDVSIRRGEGESTAPAPTHNISITPSEGREVYVFQKQEEAHVDRQSNRTPDLEDDAYEVTEADIRLQLAQFSAKRSTNHILKTKRMREQEIANMTASLGPVIVRFEFPSDVVVQASFLPTDSIGTLREFVGAMLIDEASSSFYLFTTPPKVELKDVSMSFYEAGLLPRARIHVGFTCSDSSHSNLKPEVLSSLGPPPPRTRTLDDNVERILPTSNAEQGNSLGDARTKESSRRGTSSSSSRVPAWMKLGRR